MKFYGIEPSDKMLEEAMLKSDKIKWLIGSAELIPAGDNVFGGAIAVLTIHHWKNIEKSFNELSRVLKKGSHVVIFTSTPQQMNGYWLNAYFPKMLKASITKMPSENILEAAANKAGFKLIKTEKYCIRKDLNDLFLYSGKHNPEIYFQPEVRNGISSFATLANQNEILAGLNGLRRDISTECFLNIKQQYENDFGDYLFIVFKRNAS